MIELFEPKNYTMKHFLPITITCLLSLLNMSCNTEEPHEDKTIERPYVLLCVDMENYSVLDSNGKEILNTDYPIISIKSPTEYYGIITSNHSFRIIKNGNTLYDLERGSNYVWGKMVEYNGDIYSAIRTDTHKTGIVYKNDKPLFELEPSQKNPSGNNDGISGIFINGKDIYLYGSVVNPSVGRQAVVWKNGKILYLLSDGYYWDDCTGMCVKGSDLYFCGRDKNNLVVWKNGEVLYSWKINEEHASADLLYIDCIDDDIYSCGYITTPEHYGPIGIIYKNSEIYFEEGSGEPGGGVAIDRVTKYNNEIYFSGVIQTGTWNENTNWQYINTATLWRSKNIIYEKSFKSEIYLGSYRSYFRIVG